jgi:hypothetical protein
MQVTIELPENLAALLAGDSHNLPQAVLEAVLMTAVRDAAISVAQARRILGLSRYEMDGLLKRHGAVGDMTVEDLERDTAAARSFCRE